MKRALYVGPTSLGDSQLLHEEKEIQFTRFLLYVESEATGDQETSNSRLGFFRVLSLIRFAKLILALLQYLQFLHYNRNTNF